MAQRGSYLLKINGLEVAVFTIWRTLKALDYSHKKRPVEASERDEFDRAAWKVLVADRIEAGRFVFVDEMGANTSPYPLYAWSPSGERASRSVPRNRGENTTLVASMTIEGMGPAVAIEGSTDSEVFEAYVERCIVPSLEAGQVVAMDNLNAHKGERVRDLIEEAFAKIKALLRKAETRAREMLSEALGVAIPAVTADEARSFFEHCGYHQSTRNNAVESICRCHGGRVSSKVQGPQSKE